MLGNFKEDLSSITSGVNVFIYLYEKTQRAAFVTDMDYGVFVLLVAVNR